MSKIYVDEIRHSGGAVAAINLDSSGNVGIGTTSPSSDLHIASTANPTISLEDTDNGFAASTLLVENGGRDLKITTPQDTIFVQGSTESMRIDTNGQVYIGTTDVANVDGLLLYPSGYVYSHVPGTGTVQQFRFYRNGSIVGKIQTSGTSTTYATTSDYRLKENVTADWDATTRLKQLNPVRFNFIADPDKTVDGFLAHEVQDVVPEAITGTKDEVDDDGNPEYQGIDQSKLVPLLVKTIQELEARITALENA